MGKRNLSKLVLILSVLMLVLSACGKSVEEQIAEQLELGTRYLNEGDYEEAIIAFQKVISIDKKNVAAYLGMADAYIGLNELDKAKEILELGLSEVNDEQLRKKLEEVLQLIEERYPEETEKESETEQEDIEIEELPSTDTSLAEISETITDTDTTAEETAETETSTYVTETIAETESAETLLTEPSATESTEDTMPEPSATEAAQEQGLTLKITEPISVGITYHLEDVIDGITDTTTFSEIEHQISGLTCNVVKDKDDWVGFYKDGRLLFSMWVDFPTEEEWIEYYEIEYPIFEAMDIYGDFSGPNEDKLLVIEQKVLDEQKAYLWDKPIRKDVEVWREK